MRLRDAEARQLKELVFREGVTARAFLAAAVEVCNDDPKVAAKILENARRINADIKAAKVDRFAETMAARGKRD